MKKSALFVGYVLLITLPLLASWYFIAAPRDLMRELGSMLGILAFSMILSEFLLSGRIKSLSRKLGMDRTMRLHRIVGWLVLAFTLVHPFLYRATPTAGPRPWDATRQFSVTTDFSALASGVIAFVLIPAMVVLAIWRSQIDYRYETWRRLHGLLAAAIVLLLLDHTLSAGRYAADERIALLWQALAGIALLTLVYRYFWIPFSEARKPWSLSRVEPIAERQWLVELSPNGHSGIEYSAGQFAWIKIGKAALTLSENPFSIASAPASGNRLQFVIKELGDFTSTLSSLTPGTRAYVDGPYGSLLVEGRKEPGIALIAGGVGVAPMLGIAQQLRLTDDPRAVRVLYANRTESQIVPSDALASADTLYLLSQPPKDWAGEVGLIDQQLIQRSFTQQEFDTWLFVICGPIPMMNQVTAVLRSSGVSDTRMVVEQFNYD